MDTTSLAHRTPRIALFATLALLLATLFGATVGGRPAGALGNASFKNVTVETTDTTATIRFESNAITSVYVILGTGLDPVQSKVAQVIRPYKPGHHYKAIIGGLKPNTGYSLRLASPFMSPFTDITSVVTKKPGFHNVHASVLYVSSTIDFDYPGAGPVTITISKTLDFTNHYYMRKTLTAPSSGQHWWTAFKDMDAGTAYAFQIKAPDAIGPYGDITSIVTKHRDVSLVYRKFTAIDDGDSWPHGCGDFYLQHVEQGADFNSNYWMMMFTYECVDSGHSLELTQSGMAYRDFTNVKSSTFRTDFYAWDDDRKVLDPECKPDYVSNDCGDVAWGHKYIDISTPGVHKFRVDAFGIQNSLDTYADGDVTVTFY